MITAEVQYAIKVMNHLQEHQDTVTTAELAEATDISYTFLEQINRRLRLAGWIKTFRGPGGGHVLVKKKANLLEVMQLLNRAKRKTVKQIKDPGLAQDISDALAKINVL